MGRSKTHRNKGIEEIRTPHPGKAKSERLRQDAKKHKKFREKRQDSKDLYQAVMDNNFFGLSVISRGYKIININNKLSGYFLKTVPELIGKKCFREFENRDSVCPHCAGTKAMADCKPAEFETEGILEDGRYFAARIQAFPTIGPDGRVTGFIEIVEDVAEHKKAGRALRESESKLNAMLSSIGDHMSMMDKDLNIIWANDTAKKYFGNNIVGKKCYAAFHKRNAPCEPHPCIVLKAFQDGKIHEHDTQVITKDGGTRHYHCTANAALRDESGRPTAVIEI